MIAAQLGDSELGLCFEPPFTFGYWHRGKEDL